MKLTSLIDLAFRANFIAACFLADSLAVYLIPFFKYCERCFLERNLFSVGVIFVQFNYSAQKTKRNLYPSLRVLLSIDELDLGSNANRTDPPSFCSSLAYCYVQLICSAHFYVSKLLIVF